MTAINKGDGKLFVGENESSPLAEITFKEKDEQALIVDHTYVSDELRGQGMAGKLVAEMVEFARSEGKKIIAECSYAKNKIEKTPEYHDVLAKS
ncbi:GNAT family N-acetyltransferase [Virgibacillus sp. W0430]|uniref:GNAT family N-acetyltransferase n=1 Tax=Virgibacillus sp. W0430 TaxID=3391580 RepID=UPI003F48DAE9